MKFFVKELFWGLMFFAIGFLLLPLVHVCEWSDVYLNVWVWLKENTFIQSDEHIRTAIFSGVVVIALLFSFIAVFVFYKVTFIRFAVKVRIIQLLVVCSLIFLAELYFNWQGFYPGSLYRHFRVIGNLKNLPIQQSDSSGIIRYLPSSKYLPADYRINKDGFRSNYEFDTTTIHTIKAKGKKVVMVVGDSFVAGLTAQPITNCFADLLNDETTVSLNLGQLGADPTQYELVCSVYIPLLKPDYVIVCVYENDFLTYERIPSPGIPIYYRTNSSPNGGMLLAQKPLEFGFEPNDNFTTPNEAYRFYVKHYTLRESENLAIRFCSYSALLTQLILIRNETIVGTHSKFITGSIDNSVVQEILFRKLNSIKNICKNKNVQVLFSGIPSATSTTNQTELLLRQGEDSIIIYYPPLFSVNDFNTAKGDIHFNNIGHSKYFIFLKEKMNELQSD